MYVRVKYAVGRRTHVHKIYDCLKRYGSVMVRIPIHIWETIRHLAGVEFDLVDKEDDDLLAMVESNVDQRLAKYQESLRRTAVRAEFVSLFGFVSYGGADTPRESQVRHGMQVFSGNDSDSVK